MSAPPKNQRSGPRAKQRPNLCAKGHERTWVNIAKQNDISIDNVASILLELDDMWYNKLHVWDPKTGKTGNQEILALRDSISRTQHMNYPDPSHDPSLLAHERPESE